MNCVLVVRSVVDKTDFTHNLHLLPVTTTLLNGRVEYQDIGVGWPAKAFSTRYTSKSNE